MHRIDSFGTSVSLPTPAAVGGTVGYFTKGDPVNAIPATVVSADWLNATQEELLSILTAAGVSPDKTLQNQILTSLQTLISNGGSLTQIKQAVANTQSSAADITSFPHFDSSVVVEVSFRYRVLRRTDSGHNLESGRAVLCWDPESSAWRIVGNGNLDVGGLTFVVTNISGTNNKLQYTTDTLSGATYSGNVWINDISYTRA